MAAIYFDLDGTLLRYERGFDTIFEATCDALDLSLRPDACEFYSDQFFDRFCAFDDDPYRSAATALCTEYDLDVVGDTFSEVYLDNECAATTVDAGVADALDDLSADHELGVLTNGVGSVQRRKLTAHGLDDVFDAVVVSHEVGTMKPGTDLFERARDRLPADEHVHVGDSVEDDVAGAVDAGFTAVHVDGAADVDETPDCAADYHVDRSEFDRLAALF